MKLTHLNKTLAAVGMVLFFTFGAFAVSQAHDSTPLGPYYAVTLHHLSAAEAPHAYARTAMALQFESVDIPEASRPCAAVHPFRNIDRLDFFTPVHPPQIHPAKVSLQILQSALLL